jgi:hypothetical protein
LARYGRADLRADHQEHGLDCAERLSTAALAALQEKPGGPIAVLGYAAAVPFGDILPTSGGTVIVWLVG